MTGAITRAKALRGDLSHWDGKTLTAARIDATGGTISGLVADNEVDVLQVFGSGSDRTRATIAAALSHINTSNVTLVFAPGTWTVDSNTTIGANFTCRIPSGCVFDVSSGITLTFSGDVLTEDSDNWYTGSGTVVVSREGSNGGVWHRTAAERTNSVTPTSYAYPPGHVLRYGTNTTPGTTDMASAIQAALNAGYSPFLPGVGTTYAIASTVRFKFCGQQIYGEGFGDTNTSGIFRPQTKIKWTGSAGGTMFSVYPGSGSSNLSECLLRDLLIDGDSSAAKIIEFYDDNYSGGAWRNKLQNVSVINTQAGGRAVYLGAGTGNDNCNDCDIDNTFISGAGYGITGGGATTRVRLSTIRACTVAGISLSSGAHCVTSQCVFSQNTGWDIKGSNIQLYVDHGSWFEDSTNGVYQATTAHSGGFFGSYLHTANATRLMDFQSAAGDFAIKGCFRPGGSSSAAIAGLNASYEYDFTGSDVVPSNDYRFYLPFTGTDRNGLAYIAQAKFSAHLSGESTNATGDGTAYNLTSATITELYDLNGAFSAGTFTAPAAGYYEFDAMLTLGGVAAGHTDAQLLCVTSGGTHLMGRKNPGADLVAGSDNTVIAGRAVVQMGKNDTATFTITVSGSTKVVDVLTGGSPENYRSRISGRLI